MMSRNTHIFMRTELLYTAAVKSLFSCTVVNNKKEGTGSTGTATNTWYSSIGPPIRKSLIRTKCSLFGER